ncbi:ribosomal RNA small subunit methyltransferase G [Salipiger pallidus]|uniref:Ribosomal RNA small subunit methyltransferase G n=1 Tax=Salipiger pallidus TaxID=1775170 RepID=A0A8J2ZLW9_9RHOB|nr:16S rRNA (guanine(527)-N(7))-methyltransferase RsmG [Salipiger pallidus]GGG78916.1 ribosomal RNA small subunit methyltransferase G [Salipiger pallidus]
MTVLHENLTGLDVSRETTERLQHLDVLLRKWTPKINLISKNSVNESWSRHILDSAQVFEVNLMDVDKWVDIGSGGGFPGLVVAILSKELRPDLKVVMIESDQRKCAFLRSVLRETGVKADVITARIEEVESQKADVLSARALADLTTLLGFAEHHLAPSGHCVFLKGASWEKEIADAEKTWKFTYSQRKSITDPNAVVLTIGAPTHV